MNVEKYIDRVSGKELRKEFHYFDGNCWKNICWERYYLDDNMHREDGPASIYYYENGDVSNEYYKINGHEWNRENNPFRISYNKDGSIEKYYRTNGIERIERIEKVKEMKNEKILKREGFIKTKTRKIFILEE